VRRCSGIQTIAVTEIGCILCEGGGKEAFLRGPCESLGKFVVCHKFFVVPEAVIFGAKTVRAGSPTPERNHDCETGFAAFFDTDSIDINHCEDTVKSKFENRPDIVFNGMMVLTMSLQCRCKPLRQPPSTKRRSSDTPTARHAVLTHATQLRQDPHGQDHHARGRVQRHHRQCEEQDPGQGGHPPGPAALDLRRQAARGRPHAV
jgi:hypothetical protein